MFALHWVTFITDAEQYVYVSDQFSQEVLLALCLVGASVLWAVMLLPAIPSSLPSWTPSLDAATRRADAVVRHVKAGSQAGLSLDAKRACRDTRLWMWSVSPMLQRIHNSPEYWVARLLRLLFYSTCYVVSTYWMVERTEAGTWVFDSVPRFFFVVNFVSLWTNYLDFMMDFFIGRWDFFLSLSSLVELFTQPPCILLVSYIISGLSPVRLGGYDGMPLRTLGEVWQLDRLRPDPIYYLFQFGFLRFLAAQTNVHIMLTKLRAQSTRVRVASLVVTVGCVLSVIGGATFVIEARLNGDDSFVNYLDFLYFAVVTSSTVGFGDFSPTTPLSRLVVVVAIVVTIMVVPDQVQKLQTALNEAPRSFGVPPRAGEPYVLLCGRLSPWQLQIFLRNYEKIVRDPYHKPPAKLVVLSPMPIETHLSPLHNESSATSISSSRTSHYSLPSIFFYHGDMLTSLEVGTDSSPINLREATHAFVYGGSVEAPVDDMAAMLRVLALLNFVPAWSITCMIHRSENLTMAANIGVWTTVCINDLQMRWLGKSVTDTPGIICLMANLLVSSSELGTKDLNKTFGNRLGENDDEYALEEEEGDGDEEGVEEEQPRESLSASGIPSPHPRLMRFQSQKDAAFLDAHASKRLFSYIPSRFGGGGGGGVEPARGSSHTFSHASRARNALPSRRHQHARNFVRAPADLASYLHGAEAQLIVGALPQWAVGRRASWLYEVFARLDGLQLLAVSELHSMIIWRGETRLTASMTGVYIARNEHDLDAFVKSPTPPVTASRLAEQASLPPLAGARGAEVAVGGNPPRPRPKPPASGGSGLMSGLRDSLLGAEAEVIVSNTEVQALLRGERVVILGAPVDVDRLIKQVLEASHFSQKYMQIAHVCEVRPEGVNALEERYRRKTNARGQARYTFFAADPLDHEVLKKYIVAPGLHSVIIFHDNLRQNAESRMDAVVCASKVETMLPNRVNNRVPILVSLASTADMRFVERSSWWPISDDAVTGHLTSPTYAAGQVFADEMVYPLMMSWRKQGLVSFCRNLTDQFLDPVELKLFDLPAHLAERAERADPLTHTLRDAAAGSGKGHRRSAAPLLYGELRIELLRMGLLAIGLYRLRSSTSHLDAVLHVLPFVYTNPPNSTRVRLTDRVYALQREPNRKAERKGDTSGRLIDEAARRIQHAFRIGRIQRWNQARVAEFIRAGILPPPPIRAEGSWAGGLSRGLGGINLGGWPER
mmetsp:Transcript_23606/g.59874  ORF Transcript_23606/g.59874 Transcript_23606/m.59874 type:complete len:1226 (+) Transcript_23606:65-3742(+)